MIRVLLADDQALVRDGFRALIDREPDLTVVAEAEDGVAAIALTRQHRPDVVLMDIRMPNIDGLTATQRVLALPDPPRVLVLTTFDRNEWVYEALRAGASGFLLKEVLPSDLISAIRAVASGDAVVAPAVTRRLLDAFLPHLPGPATMPPEVSELTSREREILIEVAAGLSNAEIAGRLVLAEATVKTHVGRMLGKLGLPGGPAMGASDGLAAKGV